MKSNTHRTGRVTNLLAFVSVHFNPIYRVNNFALHRNRSMFNTELADFNSFETCMSHSVEVRTPQDVEHLGM